MIFILPDRQLNLSATLFTWIDNINDNLKDNIQWKLTTTKANNKTLNLTKQMLGGWLCLKAALEQILIFFTNSILV